MDLNIEYAALSGSLANDDSSFETPGRGPAAAFIKAANRQRSTLLRSLARFAAAWLLGGGVFLGSGAIRLSAASSSLPASNVRDPAIMFSVPKIGERPEAFDWASLERVRLERGVIFAGKPPASGYNMHGYFAYFAGRYWALWSCGLEFEDVSGQYLRYATSEDGLKWSESGIVTPSDPDGELRYFARGLWVRDGELMALAARDDAWSVVDGQRKKGRLFGPRLQLIAYRLNVEKGTWEYKGVVLDNAINNFAPKRIPSGEWMMSRRDYNQKLYVAIGGVKRFDDWQTYALPDAEDGFGVDEPHWWTLPDGTLAAHFRSTTQSFARYGNFRLYRSFSNDGGRSWTAPVRTNFPDAKAKFNALRLSTGQYIMASNPKGGVDPRIPLTLSTSSDGIVFTKIRILLDEPTSARHPNPSKHSGYQYPLVSEFNGFVFIVFSKNQEDIEILRIPLSEI